MKRFLSLMLPLLLILSMVPVTALAAESSDISAFELPTPQAPDYFIYTDGDAASGHHDDLRMILLADPQVARLAAEFDRDSHAFYEKYGLYSFVLSVQYDVSLDNEEDWQHSGEWDTQYYNDGIGQGYPYLCLRSSMMEDFEFFWLTYYEGPGSNTFVPYQPAIITERYSGDGYENDVYSFDTENHSLYIRCRYYMEWEPFDAEKNEIGSKQSKFSDWSPSAVFGKDSTQRIPDEPTTYEAPVISHMEIVLPEGDSNSHIEYFQTTPGSVWQAGVYYLMKDMDAFTGLETQVSVNGGEWAAFSTADSSGDWCLLNGNRGAYNEDIPLEKDSHVRLRVRFTGAHGPSPWSNVLEVNGGGTQTLPADPGGEHETPPAAEEIRPDKCSLCGFCPVPLGLCIFIWIAIAVAVILVILLLIAAGRRRKR